FVRLASYLLRHGDKVDPRGMNTREIVNAHLTLRDPRDRLIFDKARKMNIAFAIADWVQIMVGNDDLEFLARFATAIRGFADPKKPHKLGGAYGPRLKHQEFDQIQGVIGRLKEDSNSRQAVLTIYDGRPDLVTESHVVPCTLSLQFLIRDSRLNCIATMRSNDIVWGLTYDVFNFTMIQEYVAVKVGIPLGDYLHNAGSLHLYADRDAKMVKALGEPIRSAPKMDPMPESLNIGLLYESINLAFELGTRLFWDRIGRFDNQYGKDLALVTRWWAARLDAPYEADAAYRAIKNDALRKIVRLWR
ncbi:MAG: thymidylate synthase, partial [Thermodesulfovibrionia bacterium]|nr:thymidylate synthase [Thermodesulfovibrionia bacterium]